MKPVKTIIKRNFKDKMINNLKFCENYQILIEIVVTIFSVYFLSCIHKPKSSSISNDYKLTLNIKLENMFPNQTKDFYSNVISCYEHSIVGKKDSAIIMLISDRQTTKKSIKIINK